MKDLRILFLAVPAVGLLAAGYFWLQPRAAISPGSGASGAVEESSRNQTPTHDSKQPGSRLSKIKEHATSPSARSSDKVLTDGLNDSDPEVRVAAFDVALALAKKEDGSAPAVLLRAAMKTALADMRTKALVAAREVKAVELVPDLIALFERGGPEAPLALDALALTPDQLASDTVCNVAENEKSTRSIRIRAVALLSKVDTARAIRILKVLASGKDEELMRVAMAALEIKQQDALRK